MYNSTLLKIFDRKIEYHLHIYIQIKKLVQYYTAALLDDVTVSITLGTKKE